MMDDKTKQHYLADSPPTVVRLEVKQHFDSLQDEKLKKYAHFISRLVPPLLTRLIKLGPVSNSSRVG